VLHRWFKSAGSRLAKIKSVMAKDELRILIQPHQLILARYRRGSQLAVARKIVSIELQDAGTEADGIAKKADQQSYRWATMAASLRHALTDRQWLGCVPTIVLSNHFARYLVIGWNADLANDEEQQAYLRHCFSMAYGDVVQSWDLRMSSAGYAKPALASGIPAALLHAVETEIAHAGMKAETIYPQLMLSFNEIASHLSNNRLSPGRIPSSLWMGSVEQGRLCIGLIENTLWRSVKSVAAGNDIPRQIQTVIQRESILAGISEDAPVFLHETDANGKIVISQIEINKSNTRSNAITATTRNEPVQAWG